MRAYLRIALIITTVINSGHLICQEKGEPGLFQLVDHSKSPYFPPLLQQGEMGSCDWFACAYYQMTYMRNRMLHKSCNPAEIFSPAFGFVLINNGQTYPYNMWFQDVYELLKIHGCPFLVDFPYWYADGVHYRQWPTDSSIWRKAISNRIEGYASLDFDLEKVKQLLRDGEVLVIQFNPQRSHYLKSKDNPDSELDDEIIGQYVLSSGVEGPDHTVCMVGYNDAIWIDRNENGKPEANELGAFKIAESIDDGFVNKGFRWMSYQSLCDPDSGILFQDKLWRVFLKKNYQPEVLARICLEHSQRGRLKMQLGRCARPELTSALNSTFVFDPYALGFKPGASGKSLIEGADFPFDGTQGMGTGCFTFDLTDLRSPAQDSLAYWFLRIENISTASGKLTAFNMEFMKDRVIIPCSQLPALITPGETVLFIRDPE